MNARLPRSAASSSDLDDAPELDQAFFDRAAPMIGERVVSREEFAQAARAAVRRGRPPGASKEATTIRIDVDVLAALKATGPGWQTRVNDLLRAAVQATLHKG